MVVSTIANSTVHEPTVSLGISIFCYSKGIFGAA